MSEYQYYEFQAIDRPLTEKDMGALRARSSRARITSTSFVNEYEWGNFKGNVDAWMDRYFDAFLYVANWGARELKLRLPVGLLGLASAKEYCAGDHLSARDTDGRTILTFVSNDEDGDEWVEGEGLLSSLIAVRADLARGDRRALYLGWLQEAQLDELPDDRKEPEVPAGLGQLSAPLKALVEFLRLDTDLVDVAARASARLVSPVAQERDVLSWLAKLPVAEKDAMLARLFTDDAVLVPAQLHHRFRQEHESRKDRSALSRRRTVGELLQAATDLSEEREQIAARKATTEKARKARKAAAERAKHLDSLAGQEAKLWVEVDKLAAAKQAGSYDAAVRVLIDLRDLAARKDDDAFGKRLENLRARHSRSRTLLQRISAAGL